MPRSHARVDSWKALASGNVELGADLQAQAVPGLAAPCRPGSDSYLGSDAHAPSDRRHRKRSRRSRPQPSAGGLATGISRCASARDVLRNGMDPLSFLSDTSRRSGDGCVRIVTILSHEALPKADADGCRSPAIWDSRSSLETHGRCRPGSRGAFDFVRDDLRAAHPAAVEPDRRVRCPHRVPAASRGTGGRTARAMRCVDRGRAESLRCASRARRRPPPSTGTRRLGEILVDQKAVAGPVVEAALDKQKQARDGKSQESRFIRVDADKLDRLINQIGELVIASAGAGSISSAKRTSATADLLEAALHPRDRSWRMSVTARWQLRMVQDRRHLQPVPARRSRHVPRRNSNKDVALVINGE